MKRLMAAAILALAPALAGAAGTDGSTTEAYDTLFRTGTLDAVPRDRLLVYDREVAATFAEEPSGGTGAVALSVEEGDAALATLTLRREAGQVPLGSFPAGVGNPMIMYFYESTVRDMAAATGGSPFYIRNRMKEALARDVAVERGQATFDGREVATRRVTLRPFEGDENAARMEGFADLSLTVTMSDAVPGWYLSLEAVAPGPEGAAAPLYRSVTRLRGTEAAP